MTENKSITNNIDPASEPETGVCASCGTVHPLTELYTVDCYQYCSDCLERETVVCSHCGCRILFDDNAGTCVLPLCQRCYDNHYTSCENCGEVIHRDNACYDDDDGYDAYCSRCYRCHSRGGIEEYYYKPDPIFYGEGSRYLGQ